MLLVVCSASLAISSSAQGAPVAARQPGGRILVTTRHHGHLALVAVAVDGTLDKGFGSGGYASTGLGQIARELAIVVQSDGTIDLAVQTLGDGHPVQVVQFTRNGQRDTAFGDHGIATAFASGAAAAGITATAGGDLFVGSTRCVAGTPKICTHSVPVVAKLQLGSGDLDPSFGQGGIATLDGLSSSEAFTALAVQADGSILAGGSAYYPSPSILARLLPDGSPDPSFGGGDGVIETQTPITEIALDGAGRIIAGGAVGTFTYPEDFGVARVDSTGAPDNGFAGGVGSVGAELGAPTFTSGSLLRGPGGALTIAGAVAKRCAPNSPGSDPPCRTFIFLFRYTAEGLADPDFGGDGFVSMPITRFRHGSSLFDHATVVREAERTVAIARGYYGPRNAASGPVLVGYRADGGLATHFGQAGFARLPIDSCSRPACPNLSARLQPGENQDLRLKVDVDSQIPFRRVRVRLPGALAIDRRRARRFATAELGKGHRLPATGLLIRRHGFAISTGGRLRNAVSLTFPRGVKATRAIPHNEKLTLRARLVHGPGIPPSDATKRVQVG